MSANDGQNTISVGIDEGFAEWMSRFPGFLAISTYQAGKVVLVGWDGQRVTILPRTFDKPMGMAHLPAKGGDPFGLAMATRNEIAVFANAPLLAADFHPDRRKQYDALMLPRTTFHTGNLNSHDVAYCTDGLWFVNTQFSCLCRLSETYSFVPAWKPPFVGALAPEDRCHLNGLCVVDGRPKYATCFGETDTPGGWRTNKLAGGAVVDVDRNEIVCRSLCMPHSPRWNDGKLWVLDSGRGELSVVDASAGRPRAVLGLPAYLRGLTFVGNTALVGMCKVREKHIEGNLPVRKRFANLACGIVAVDLLSGQIHGKLEFASGCTELYDIVSIEGSRQPMLTNLEREESRQAFTAPEFAYWLRSPADKSSR